jgi:hypothetical protein
MNVNTIVITMSNKKSVSYCLSITYGFVFVENIVL